MSNEECDHIVGNEEKPGGVLTVVYESDILSGKIAVSWLADQFNFCSYCGKKINWKKLKSSKT